MKLDLETIEIRLKQQARDLGLNPDQVSGILKDLQATAEEEKQLRNAEAGEKEKSGAPIPILIATGDHPDLERIIRDIPFFLAEIPDDADHTTVVERATRAAYEYNQDLLSKRGSRRKRYKRQPLENFGDLAESLPRTFLKPQGIKMRFKVPCLVVVTCNELVFPTAEPESTQS